MATRQSNGASAEAIEKTFEQDAPQPDSQQVAQTEARFWKAKYFEALQYSQSQAQVIIMLARPQMQQDAKQQAELIAKLTGMQAK